MVQDGTGTNRNDNQADDRRPDSGGRGGYNRNVVLQDDHYYRHSHSRDSSPDRSDGNMYDYDYNEDAD